MATYLPTSTRNAMLSGAFPAVTTFYWGFSTTTPGLTGAHEVTGTATHKRQASKVATPVTGKAHTSQQMTWVGMPACTIKFFVINTAATGAGSWVGAGPLAVTISVPADATIAAGIGAFTLAVTG